MAYAIDDEQLDPGAVRELLDIGGEEFLAELAEIFLNDLQPRLDTLDEAIERADNVGAANVAHAIKGSSLYLGLRSLAELTAQMEISQRAGALDDGQKLLADIHRAAAKARLCLEGVIAR